MFPQQRYFLRSSSTSLGEDADGNLANRHLWLPISPLLEKEYPPRTCSEALGPSLAIQSRPVRSGFLDSFPRLRSRSIRALMVHLGWGYSFSESTRPGSGRVESSPLSLNRVSSLFRIKSARTNLARVDAARSDSAIRSSTQSFRDDIFVLELPPIATATTLSKAVTLLFLLLPVLLFYPGITALQRAFSFRREVSGLREDPISTITVVIYFHMQRTLSF